MNLVLTYVSSGSVSHLGYPKTALILLTALISIEEIMNTGGILRAMQPLVSLPADPPRASPPAVIRFHASLLMNWDLNS